MWHSGAVAQWHTLRIGIWEIWEIWDGVDGVNLILAGESAGHTAMPPGKDGIWRGKGIVTEANVYFEDWIGHQMYEGGNVDLAVPWSGSGIFRIK